MLKKISTMLIATCLLLTMLTIPALAEKTFTDMPNDYSTEALEKAVANGYLVGMDGKIMPDDSITTAQVMTLLVRAFDVTEMADISMYTDVSEDDWFYSAMASAVGLGMVEARDNMLYPNEPMSRQDSFKALALAFGITGSGDKAVLSPYTDMAEISDWARTEIIALIEAGVVEGYNDMIHPEANIKRKDFAVIMDRAMNLSLTHTVTFKTSVTHSFTGEEIVMTDSKEVMNNYLVEMPDEPINTVVIDGIDVDKWYDFRGWYTDAELSNRWDFEKPVSADMMLYSEFVHIPDPPTNTHFSFINKMFTDSDGVILVQGVEDGHEYGPMALADGLEIEKYMASMDDEVAGYYLAFTIGDRKLANAVSVPAMDSGAVTAISAEGVALDDGEMIMFDEQIYMYWAHEDGTYSVYNKVAGRFPVEDMTEEHLPIGSYVSLYDARTGSDTFAQGEVDAIIVRMVK